MLTISPSIEFVQSDGGRADAGFEGHAGDCVTRAIAIATGRDYREVYQGLWDLGRQNKVKNPSPRDGCHRKAYEPYMIAAGFEWFATMGIGTGCNVHLRANELPSGNLVCRVSKHMCAVIDGVLHDLSDCSREGTRCVYGYFWKP